MGVSNFLSFAVFHLMMILMTSQTLLTVDKSRHLSEGIFRLTFLCFLTNLYLSHIFVPQGTSKEKQDRAWPQMYRTVLPCKLHTFSLRITPLEPEFLAKCLKVLIDWLGHYIPWMSLWCSDSSSPHKFPFFLIFYIKPLYYMISLLQDLWLFQ